MPIILVEKVFDDPAKTLAKDNIKKISDDDTVVVAAIAKPDGEGEYDLTMFINGYPHEVTQILKELTMHVIEEISKKEEQHANHHSQ
jgi:hypothetical protein